MAAPNRAGLLRQARDYELIGSRKTVGGGEGQGSKAQEASPHHLQTLNPARTPRAPRPDTQHEPRRPGHEDPQQRPQVALRPPVQRPDIAHGKEDLSDGTQSR